MVKHKVRYTQEFKKIPFTQEGYDCMQKELVELESARPEAVATLARARALGDLSENGMYKAARARLSSIDHRRERLKDLMKLAEITAPSGRDVIEIGSRVIVSQDGRRQTIMIVGGYESDPSEGKISHISPLGQALIKQSKGAVVTVQAPVGAIEYRVEDIL